MRHFLCVSLIFPIFFFFLSLLSHIFFRFFSHFVGERGSPSASNFSSPSTIFSNFFFICFFFCLHTFLCYFLLYSHAFSLFFFNASCRGVIPVWMQRLNQNAPWDFPRNWLKKRSESFSMWVCFWFPYAHCFLGSKKTSGFSGFCMDYNVIFFV
jgi:hypothetical protein